MATVAITKTSFAQYSRDAILFSTSQPGSTSRIKAIGNAQMAVGGDLSSVSGNPAGIGFFTRSELSITPEFNATDTKSTYLGQSNSGKSNNVNFNNAAVVFYTRLNTPRGQDKSKGWLSVNWGASYNRTNNFYQNTYYSGVNTNSSVTDYYTSLANQALDQGYSLDGYLEGWAYNQGLINFNTGADQYQPSGAFGGTQTNRTTSSGGQTELNLSMGANYSNKLYLGLGLGFTTIRYNTTTNFSEDNVTLANRQYVANYSFDQATRGNGFNARLGFIYKPVNALRIGATLTTPTWYTVDDVSSEGLATQYAGSARMSDGDTYQTQYNLRTPLKVAGGLAIFVGKYGFITGDVEYLDYSNTKLTSNEYNVDNDNRDIRTLYRSTVNARAGAEARIAGALFFRGGYGIQGNPLKQNGSDIKTASGGLGYRFGNYYIDATYTHVTTKQNVQPYDIGVQYSPVAALQRKGDNAYLTLGIRF